MLNEALSAYGLNGANSVLLGHSENEVYQVDGRFVLRIHRSMEGMSLAGFTGGHSPASLRRTELAFLRHLAERGLNVQQPVSNLHGEDVTVLPDGTPVTLLTWLEGTDLPRVDELSPETCREMGRLTHRLHRAAAGFCPAASPRYDEAHCITAMNVLTAIPFPAEDKALFLNVLEKIRTVFSHRNDAAIMLHGDLSRSNLLATSRGLAPIDFSLCGLGHPMFDLAILCASLQSGEQVSACKAGYAESGALDEEAYAAGFALGLMGMFVMRGKSLVTAPWFPNAMRRWRAQILLPYLEGRLSR